jgi:hypothetical protein
MKWVVDGSDGKDATTLCSNSSIGRRKAIAECRIYLTFRSHHSNVDAWSVFLMRFIRVWCSGKHLEMTKMGIIGRARNPRMGLSVDLRKACLLIRSCRVSRSFTKSNEIKPQYMLVHQSENKSPQNYPGVYIQRPVERQSIIFASTPNLVLNTLGVKDQPTP